MERIPVWVDGAARGEARLDREGLYTRVTVRVPVSAGLWCAWLTGEGDAARIGILEPSGGMGEISRRLSGRALLPLGGHPRCEVRPAGDRPPVLDSGPPVPENPPPVPDNGPPAPESRPVTESGSRDTDSIPPIPEGWTVCGTPETLFESPWLSGQVRRWRETAPACGPALCRAAGGRVQTAFPMDGGKPFPLPGLFCFSALWRLSGVPYWVFAFGRGTP